MSKEALEALLAKVEAGTLRDINSEHTLAAMPRKTWGPIVKAYSGSLEAAKALHDGMLPDRPVSITFGGEYGASVHYAATWDSLSLTYSNKEPARAWLIAILRALIAKETE